MRKQPGESNPVEIARLPQRPSRKRSRPTPLPRGVGNYERYFPPSEKQKALRRLNIAGRVIAITLAGPELLLGIMTVDGLIVEHDLANTQPSITDVTDEKVLQANLPPSVEEAADTSASEQSSPDEEVEPTQEYADPHMATFVTLGYGALTALDVGKEKSPQLSKLGRVLVLNYDNRGINIDRIVDIAAQVIKKDHLKKAAFEEKHNRPKTYWVYLGNPHDYIVNTPQSAHQYSEYISEAHFPELQTEMVPGIIHGLPTRTPDLYKKLYNDDIIPGIQAGTEEQNTIVAAKIASQKNVSTNAEGSSRNLISTDIEGTIANVPSGTPTPWLKK